MNKEEKERFFKEIEEGKREKEKLLLHACCAPCTSGVFPQLEKYFDITILYYNPNTYPESEYNLRFSMLEKLNNHMNYSIIRMDYDENEYFDKVKGHEKDKEGGERCMICYELRMRKTAEYAKENGFNFFTTTLSVSPYKNAQALNEIGFKLEKEYGITYLYSDFKKNEGYKNSIKLSKEFDLYRQEYCGCKFSKEARDNN